ncbi:hypothetical protein M885DRAFT_561150 [Pelagophyceae sp. CCMP2097]|nr:hypothetical protein M885DRAFT_561150 [Pelagophyceae sp. CCMP2097]
MGGSRAVSRETGTWSANVTRWLDAVLGAAADGEGYARLVDGAACAGQGGDPYGARLGHGCARFAESLDAWAWEPLLYYADAGTWHGDEGAAWQASDWPIGRVCENQIFPKRKCLLFWGSGKHATVVNGGQGDAGTYQGAWALSRALLPAEGLDLLSWDDVFCQDWQDNISKFKAACSTAAAAPAAAPAAGRDAAAARG